MAALDFPAAPINGQVFTGVGGINWVWDGAKWNPGTLPGAGQFVPLAGGTMTGPLVLSGPPTQPLQAATKGYVDGGFLPLTGGTLTGSLTVPSEIIQAPAASWSVLELKKPAAGMSSLIVGSMGGSTRWWLQLGNEEPETGGNAGSNFGIFRYDDNGTQINRSFSINRATGIATLVDGVAANNVGRNLIHNPLFNIAQRGAGPFTTGAFTLDRWGTFVSGDTISLTQTALTDTQRSQIGDDAAVYCMRNVFTGNASATSYNLVQQRIEGVRRFGGKTVTLSFYAACAAGTLQIGVGIDQYFGTGGSPSAAVFGTGVPVTINTTFTRYSVTVALASTIGKTVGTNNDDWIQPIFWLSSGANNATKAGIGVQSGTVYLWGVQLEIGSTMTPLEKPDPADDLAKCQRFYQTGVMQIYTYSPTASGIWGAMILPFPVTMRAAPTITPSWSSQNSCTGSMTAQGAGNYQVYLTATATGGVNASGTFTASADL